MILPELKQRAGTGPLPDQWREWRSRAVCLLGAGLILLGLAALRLDVRDPLRWQPLQDAISAVFPNPRAIVYGTILVLLGGLLFGWAGQAGVPAPAPVAEDRPEKSRQAPRRLSLVLGLLAASLYGVTIALILSGSTGYGAGVLFLASLAAAALAVATWAAPSSSPLSRWEVLALTAAALAACALFLHDIHSWFFSWTGDEYAFYQAAQGILHGYVPNVFSQQGVYGYHPVADSLYQALVMRLLGPDVVGWKGSSALAAALTVFPLYLLGRAAFSRLAGALAVGFFIPAQIILAYTHIGYNNLDALFPLTAAVALFVAGQSYGSRLYLFLAGLVAGLAWYTFFTARFGIVLLALGVLVYRFGALRRAAVDAGLILGGFIPAVLPLLLVNGQSVVTAMTGQSAGLGHQYSTPLAPLLAQNTVRALFAFVYSTQVDNHYIAGAMFDSASAFFLLLGLAALLTVTSRAGALVLLWYGLLVLITCVTFYGQSIPTTRVNAVLPAACLIAAAGAATLLSRLSAWLPVDLRRATVAGGAALTVGIVAVLNLVTFYREVPVDLQATPQALEIKVIDVHPAATVVAAPDVASTIFPLAIQAYDVSPARSVQAYGYLQMRQAMDQADRRVIVVSKTPPTLPGTRDWIVWDPAHHDHLYLAARR